MANPPDLERIGPDVLLWQAYDPKGKVDLFSTLILTEAGWFVIDPIPISDQTLRDGLDGRPLAGIVVTNANHHRASAEFSDRFSLPIYAHGESFPEIRPPNFVEAAEGNRIGDALEVVTIEGAVPGEIALHHPGKDGTWIIGDALINFEPYGFTFLPRKYCLNGKKMRHSLHKLLARSAERALFAHGTPILSGANQRFRQLFDGDA